MNIQGWLPLLCLASACGQARSAPMFEHSDIYSQDAIDTVVGAVAQSLQEAMPDFIYDVDHIDWTLQWADAPIPFDGVVVDGLTHWQDEVATVTIHEVEGLCLARTALPHELIHLALWRETGDADGAHAEPGVWAPNVPGTLAHGAYKAAIDAQHCGDFN